MQSHHLRQRGTPARPSAIVRFVVVLALALAGCGSGQDTGPATAAPAAGDDVAQPAVLPDLSVTDIATGDQVALRSLVPADRPVLLWFWAPH